MSANPMKTAKKASKVFVVGFAVFVIAVIAIATGPAWTIDDVTKSGAQHSVTCHEKWHTDHVKKIAVTAAGASTLKKGDECPS
jgi:hypothetical protein